MDQNNYNNTKTFESGILNPPAFPSFPSLVQRTLQFNEYTGHAAS